MIVASFGYSSNVTELEFGEQPPTDEQIRCPECDHGEFEVWRLSGLLVCVECSHEFNPGDL